MMKTSEIRTKIVCTIGPATWEPKILQILIDHGMTVARINASFADAAEIIRVTKLIRELSDQVCVMLDLKGHKIRVSDFGEPKQLTAGEELILSTDPKSEHISISYPDLHKDMHIGGHILIDDGKIRLEVIKIEGTEITCRVLNNAVLKRLKTVNVPGTYLSFDPLTEKDKVDIGAGVEAGVDLIAGSFVRDLNDVIAIRDRIGDSDIGIIAKIEDPLGVKNFDEILENVYGIMVARGDLGVELPYEQIPVLQKEFVKKCRSYGKPVIVATHMLESMTSNPAPTRAEVNDVANAIYDDTDAVMTSAETSTGQYPIETISVMHNIAKYIEPRTEIKEYDLDSDLIKQYNFKVSDDIADRAIAIAGATVDACQTLDVKSVIVVSKGGFTARLISRQNIPQPIYAFTETVQASRRLAMSKGIYADMIPELSTDRDIATKQIIAHAKNEGLVAEGDLVALVIGSQMFSGVNASTLELQRIS
jgi:pyruvate kinase